MKKVLIIYNPASGDRSFVKYLDQITKTCIELEYLPVYYSVGLCNQNDRLFDDTENYTLLLISGGDGTVNRTINQLFRNEFNIPVGIIPSGTANDFATALGIKGHPVAITKKLLSGKQTSIDIGWVNERYFINVINVGITTTISEEVNNIIKNNLGVTAYYLHGLQYLWNISPIRVTIETDKFIVHEEIILLLVLNSSTAGTFRNIAPNADISDGLLDILMVRKCSLKKLLTLILKAYKGMGEHLNSPLVNYYQARWIKVTSHESIKTDIDGEPGPYLPLDVKILPKQLTLLVPS